MEFRKSYDWAAMSGRPGSVQKSTALGKAEREVLRSTNVLIAGCGPVGSQLAIQLVSSGAEWLTLAEPERVARRKSAGLADRLFDVNPFATVETTTLDPTHLDNLITNTDLVIDALDTSSRESLKARYHLHAIAKRHSRPVVAALDAGASGLAIVYDYRERNLPVLDDVLKEPPGTAVDCAAVLRAMIEQVHQPGAHGNLPASIEPVEMDDDRAAKLAGVFMTRLLCDLLFNRQIDRLMLVDGPARARSGGGGLLAAGRKITALYSLRRKLRDARRKEKPNGFTPLDDEIFRDLRPYMEERTYEAGSVVIRQGDPAEYFFVLVEGRVQVEHEEHEMPDAPDDFDYEPISTYTVIAELGPGDFFGEMALLSDAPRNASVVVTERCQVLALSRGAFNLYLEESQPAFERLREIALARRYENHETYGF
jgi:CRP-like cAMP-binding protein